MEWNWWEKMKAVMKSVLEKGMLEKGIGAAVVASDKMTGAIGLWDAMYRNQAPWLGGTVSSLNLAATVASELARLTVIELQSRAEGSGRGEWLNQPYQKVLGNLRRQVEYGCAKGGLVLKPYVTDGHGLAVDFVQNDGFFPTAFDSAGKITGAVFVDRRQVAGAWFTKLEHQQMQADGLHIKNAAYRSPLAGQLGAPVPLKAIGEWAGLAPEAVLANVNRPLFAYFKVPHANTVDCGSPLGASVYARAVGLMEEADRQYSRILWEYEAGEMAVDADETLFRRDSAGQLLLPRGRERLFRVLTGIDDDGKKLNAWAPELRDASLFRGLNEMLKRIEDLCGLARGTFSTPDSQAKTATELKILQQRSYATVRDLQGALQQALEDLVGCMDVLATVYGLAPAGEYRLAFDWDDSIVADVETERRQDLLEVQEGIMQRWEYRAKWYGEEAETARSMMAEAGGAKISGN